MTATPDPSRDDHDLTQDAYGAARRPDEHGPDELSAAELTERLRAPGEELTEAELAALYRLSGGWPDPRRG
jgi:hypothetical protein